MSIAPVAPERRHTLHFLAEIRPMSPVFLDTDVDMTAVQAARAAARSAERSLSTVTCVLHTAGQVLAKHPEANAAIRGRWWPRVAAYPSVNGKLTFDKTVNGRRVVLSAVLPDLQDASLDDIQRQVEHYRDGDPERMAEFAGVRALHRMPWLIGRAAFGLGVRPLSRRAAAFGTVAVTSLGHRPVDGFHSVGGTTVTLGLGQVADRPVVRDGQLAIAPLMRLSLTFDHRVIDGAAAADVLADLKSGLESFGATTGQEGVPA